MTAVALAPGDRAPRIGNPLAPGSAVEPAAGQAGRLEAQQVVAGSDARAAHGDQLVGWSSRETLPPALLERRGGQKSAVGGEIHGKRMIYGAGYVTGHLIDGF